MNVIYHIGDRPVFSLRSMKNRENNWREKIGLVTPTRGVGLYAFSFILMMIHCNIPGAIMRAKNISGNVSLKRDKTRRKASKVPPLPLIFPFSFIKHKLVFTPETSPFRVYISTVCELNNIAHKFELWWKSLWRDGSRASFHSVIDGGRDFADDILKCSPLNENFEISNFM